LNDRQGRQVRATRVSLASGLGEAELTGAWWWCERWVGEVNGADPEAFADGKDAMTQGRARCHRECMAT
jgi:hypothetical protein